MQSRPASVSWRRDPGSGYLGTVLTGNYPFAKRQLAPEQHSLKVLEDWLEGGQYDAWEID
jgi:hypothetical protein